MNIYSIPLFSGRKHYMVNRFDYVREKNSGNLCNFALYSNILFSSEGILLVYPLSISGYEYIWCIDPHTKQIHPLFLLFDYYKPKIYIILNTRDPILIPGGLCMCQVSIDYNRQINPSNRVS